jgi:hypothetical protein
MGASAPIVVCGSVFVGTRRPQNPQNSHTDPQLWVLPDSVKFRRRFESGSRLIKFCLLEPVYARAAFKFALRKLPRPRERCSKLDGTPGGNDSPNYFL